MKYNQTQQCDWIICKWLKYLDNSLEIKYNLFQTIL